MAKKIIDLGSSEVDEKDVESVDIFKLDGKVYSAPKNMPFSTALEFMEAQVEQGPDAAVFMMLKAVLGQEAFDALKKNKNLTEEQFQEVVSRVEEHLLAGEEGK